MEGLELPDSRRVLHTRGLDHPATGSARHLAAVGGALLAVELNQREPEPVRGSGHLVERLVHEHPGELGPPPQPRPDLLRDLWLAAPRTAGPEDHPERPRAEPGGSARILEVRDAADLDPCHDLIGSQARAGYGSSGNSPPPPPSDEPSALRLVGRLPSFTSAVFLSSPR